MPNLQTIEARMSKTEGEIKRGNKDATKEKELLIKLLAQLETGNRVSEMEFTEEEEEILKHLHLLSSKPILYMLNKKVGAFNFDEQNDERWKELQDFFESKNAIYVFLDAGIEHEIRDMEGDERGEFRKELGATPDSGVDEMIKKAFTLLNLITYFTTGEDETRAWPIPKGWNAPMAGKAIHTDFKTKFIKADVIGWNELLDAGSRADARDKGLIRTEGKEYIVKDGDVIEFKI